MNNHSAHERTIFGLGTSIFLHAILLLIIFIFVASPDISLFDPPKASSQITPIAAPIILYSGSPQPLQKTVVSQKQILKQVQPVQQTIPKQQRPSSDITKKTEKNKTEPVGKNNKIIKKETIKKSLVEKTEEPALFKIAEESSLSFGGRTFANAEELRRYKLTLADLFKKMPHHLTAEQITTGTEKGSGKQTLVISQGDMKYYSFLQKFVTHINQVFSFHGGPDKARVWAKKGLIKKNTGISIVIDKAGKVINVILTYSSGYKPFDELSIDTVKQASPFPPVPDYFNHEKVRIELSSYL